MNFEPIGVYHSSQRFRFETPRQSVFIHNSGVITLQADRNFETALEDLDGFDRIWVIFQFHLNDNWRPKVRPPVAPVKEKIGVFATRSPHRPNPIGMSCVKLEKVDGLNVFVQDCDLLDESPVLDIKPYIPAADSFPGSGTGWLERAVVPQSYQVRFTPEAQLKLDFLKENGFDAENFCQIQLGSDPVNPERKRIYQTDSGYEIGFRTWRIPFIIKDQTVTVYDVRSNYKQEELLEGMPDKYGDKPLHRAFQIRF